MTLAPVNESIGFFLILRNDERDSLIGLELTSATNTPEPGFIINNNPANISSYARVGGRSEVFLIGIGYKTELSLIDSSRLKSWVKED